MSAAGRRRLGPLPTVTYRYLPLPTVTCGQAEVGPVALDDGEDVGYRQLQAVTDLRAGGGWARCCRRRRGRAGRSRRRGPGPSRGGRRRRRPPAATGVWGCGGGGVCVWGGVEAVARVAVLRRPRWRLRGGDVAVARRSRGGRAAVARRSRGPVKAGVCLPREEREVGRHVQRRGVVDVVDPHVNVPLHRGLGERADCEREDVVGVADGGAIVRRLQRARGGGATATCRPSRGGRAVVARRSHGGRVAVARRTVGNEK